MAFNVREDLFKNPDIAEAVSVLKKVGTRRYLGIKRWDNVLKRYPFSGTVVIPVKLGYKIMKEPFYFVIEKIGYYECLRVKPVKGEQWGMGDVFGFFGLHDFSDFTYEMPILIVEGISDWGVCKGYYKYVLASLSAHVGYRQAFLLSNLSKNIFIGFDNDETGAKSNQVVKERLNKFDCNVGYQIPPLNDWGKMFEDEFGRKMLDDSMGNFIKKVNKINEYIYG